MFQSNSVREQQHQQMEMVQSICIPRVFPNITEAKIRKVFSTLDIGEVDKIDMVSKTNSKGQEYKIVFIHMLKWNNTETIRKMKEKLIQGKDVKIVYDDPWFWKVVINHKKQQPSNSSHTTQYPEQSPHPLKLQLPENCPIPKQQRLQNCNDADYRRYDDLQSSHIHQHQQQTQNNHHRDEYSGNSNCNGYNNYSQEQYYQQTQYDGYSSRSRGDERGRRGVGGCGNGYGVRQEQYDEYRYDNQRQHYTQLNNQHYNQQL
jgi:hypothetical protein